MNDGWQFLRVVEFNFRTTSGKLILLWLVIGPGICCGHSVELNLSRFRYWSLIPWHRTLESLFWPRATWFICWERNVNNDCKQLTKPSWNKVQWT